MLTCVARPDLSSSCIWRSARSSASRIGPHETVDRLLARRELALRAFVLHAQALPRELEERLGVGSELLVRELSEHARESLRRELHDALALDLERRAAAELGVTGREPLAYAHAARIADRKADSEPREPGEQRNQQRRGVRHAAALSAASASSRSSGRRMTASAPQSCGSSLGRM